MPQRLHHLLPILGTLVFSLMTLAMLVVALIWSQWAIGAVIFAVLFGIGALYSLVTAFRHFRERQDKAMMAGIGQEESRILKLAAQEEGYLTAEEAAMECKISIQQAEALLDELVNQGRADVQVSEGGSMVYVFRNLLEDDKKTAEDPLKLLESS